MPVGAYLVFHLWTNAKAMQGRQVFEAAVTEVDRLPYLAILEIGAIAVPLLFHAVLGVIIALEARPNPGRYPTARNTAYLLQRVTGVLVLAFLVLHVAHLRLPVALGTLEKADLFPTLCDLMSTTAGPGIPVYALLYLLGTAAAVYHLTVGLHGFCFSWGITLSRRANHVAAGVFGVLGLVLFALGANTIIYYATGSRFVFDAPARDGNPPALTCRDVGAGEPSPPTAAPAGSVNPGATR